MSQLILSPTSTSIYATVSGLEIDTTNSRVIQYFLDSSATPSAETLIAAGSIEGEYTNPFYNLKTNSTHKITVKVIDYETEVVQLELEANATCGGTTKDPMFNITDITSNSAIIELYRGNPSYAYYRLYVFDTEDEEAIFTEWLKPDSYPKQLTGLSDSRLYKVNVGYGSMYGGSTTWIGTQTFTTSTEFDTGHSDTGAFTMPSDELDRNVVGVNAESIKSSTFNNTFSRVTITTQDDENNNEIAYSVGDDTGLELTLSCPWLASNEHDAIKIATYVLSTVNGYAYQPFTSSETLLDPAAELGDIISFDTITSEIVNLDINYDRLFNADVSAPVSNETEHEFPQGATSKDETKRYVDGVKASLEVEIDNITAMVEDNNGRFQKLQITLDGVIIQNENGQTEINGAHIQTGTIELKNQMYNGSSFQTKINSMDSATAAKTSLSSVRSDLLNNYGIDKDDAHAVLTDAYIYAPSLYAGETSSSMVQIDETGILFANYSNHVIGQLGYESITSGSATYQLPIFNLGQGGGTSESGSGVMKKYFDGIWVGEYFSDSGYINFETSSSSGMDRANAAGVFFDVSTNGIALSEGAWGPLSDRPSASDAIKGQIYIATS